MGFGTKLDFSERSRFPDYDDISHQTERRQVPEILAFEVKQNYIETAIKTSFTHKLHVLTSLERDVARSNAIYRRNQKDEIFLKKQVWSQNPSAYTFRYILALAFAKKRI